MLKWCLEPMVLGGFHTRAWRAHRGGTTRVCGAMAAAMLQQLVVAMAGGSADLRATTGYQFNSWLGLQLAMAYTLGLRRG